MRNWAVAGANVLCIKTWQLPEGTGYGDEQGPVSGEVYTLREVGSLHPLDAEGVYVRLFEICNPVRYYRGGLHAEPCFALGSFIPLDAAEQEPPARRRRAPERA